MRNRVQKVAVAMSGGVDSSVAAYLLKEQGFEVHGFFMRNWSPLSDIKNDCSWQKDYEDVRRVCRQLGISYGTFNFEKEYKDRVLSYFLREYQAGRTPNPDVLCNREIKFDAFLKKAKTLGFDYIATGHYAKLETRSTQSLRKATVGTSNLPSSHSASSRGRHELRQTLFRPKDREKDQTYFLCYLKPEQLAYAIFPLGDLTKDEVREIARKTGLPNADKKDSQGICFIGKLPVREFLKKNLQATPGKVIAVDGRILGEHDGFELYTIGQRHIGVAANGEVLYVTKKDPATQTLIMDKEEALYTDTIRFTDANWLNESTEDFSCDVQIRYRTQAIRAQISISKSEIYLKNPARAVTTGQYVAFYQNDRLIGGAVIA